MSEDLENTAPLLPPDAIAAAQQAPPPVDSTSSAADKKKKKKKKKKKNSSNAPSAPSPSGDTIAEDSPDQATPVLEDVEDGSQPQETSETTTPIAVPETPILEGPTAIDLEKTHTGDAVVLTEDASTDIVTSNEPELPTTVSHSAELPTTETPVAMETLAQSKEYETLLIQDTSKAEDDVPVQSFAEDVSTTETEGSADSNTNGQYTQEDSSSDSLFATSSTGQPPSDQTEAATSLPPSQDSETETEKPVSSILNQPVDDSVLQATELVEDVVQDQHSEVLDVASPESKEVIDTTTTEEPVIEDPNIQQPVTEEQINSTTYNEVQHSEQAGAETLHAESVLNPDSLSVIDTTGATVVSTLVSGNLPLVPQNIEEQTSQEESHISAREFSQPESVASAAPVVPAQVPEAPVDASSILAEEVNPFASTIVAEEVNPFASSADAPLPWETPAPVEPSTAVGSLASQPESVEQENPFTSSAPTPLPWETVSDAPVASVQDNTKTKFADLDLELLDADTTIAGDSGNGAHTELANPVATVLADSTQDFAAMIGKTNGTSQETDLDAVTSKFAFIDLDDDLLPDEPTETVPTELGLSQPQVTPATQTYQSNPQILPPQRSQSYQPTIQQQNQFQPQGQFQQLGGQQFYQQNNPLIAAHQPTPPHHLDVQKLNEDKKKSDAYDFPMDLMPKIPVHKVAVPQAALQNIQKYQVSQGVGIPSHVSPVVQTAINPYAPRTQPPTPGLPSHPPHPAGPPGAGISHSSAPNIQNKQQSSFFQDLPPLPLKKTRAPSSSSTSMSPMMNPAAPTQPYGAPPPVRRGSQAPPTGAPMGISRPPSRPPVIVQPNMATSPLNPSAIPTQQVPAAGFNQYAPPSAQQNGNQAPQPSRYAPVAHPVGNSGLPPPPTQQQDHLRKPSYPGQVQQDQVSQSPQPELSHMLGSANRYAPVTQPGNVPPLAGAQIYQQPGSLALPQIQTTAPSSLAPPQVEPASKSPLHSAVTPSSTRYAPINHKRQASSSAAQYDPYSAHKLASNNGDLDRITQNSGLQQQYIQQPGLAPPQQQYQQNQQPHQAQSVGYAQPGLAPPSVPVVPPQAQGVSYAPRQSVYGPPSVAVAPPQAQDASYAPRQSVYGPPSVQGQFGASVEPISNPDQLRARQFPLFSWSNSSKIASFVSPMQYGTQTGIKVVKADEILQDVALKEFQFVSKKNAAAVDKFLDSQYQRVSQRREITVNDELLLIQLLKHKVLKAPGEFNLGGSINYNDSGVAPAFNENFNKVPKAPLNKRTLVAHLSNGDTAEALNLAMSHQNYALALLISSIISKDSWFNLVDSYLGREFGGDQDHFLPLLFRIMSGDIENVMKLLSTNVQKREWAVSNWRAIATAVITNKPSCLNQFLSLFGTLLIQSDQVIPALILFVIADTPLSSCHIGKSISCTLYLEIYGTLLQEKVATTDLSVLYLQHASFLVDYNMLTEAQKYLDASSSSYKASKRSDPAFLHFSKCLSNRLSGAGIEAGWFVKPKLERVWGTLDKGLNMLISGDEPTDDPKDKAVFSKFSPSVSRSTSHVSMSNLASASDFQNQRHSVSSSPYAPTTFNGTLPPARSYAPTAARGAATGSLSAMGGQHQAYTPPQFPHVGSSVSSSPKPVRSDSITTSPMHKPPRYALSDAASRRSSVHSNASGHEEFVTRPSFSTPGNNAYQPPSVPPVMGQLASPVMASAKPVPSSKPYSYQAHNPIASSPAVGGIPKRSASTVGDQTAILPKVEPPSASNSGLHPGTSLNDLVSQEKARLDASHKSTYLPVTNSPLRAPVPESATERILPSEGESSFESTLQSSNSTITNQEENVDPHDVVTAYEQAPVPPFANQFDSSETIKQIDALTGSNDFIDDEGGNIEFSGDNVTTNKVAPETPDHDDSFDRAVASVTQSEMGSTSATPYVVPESVGQVSGIEEHDVPADIQQKIEESEPNDVSSPAAVPYAPPPQQQPSPYAPSPYAPGSAPPKPPLKSKVSGRFTPKSYTPNNEASPAGPILSEEINYNSITPTPSQQSISVVPTAPPAPTAQGAFPFPLTSPVSSQVPSQVAPQSIPSPQQHRASITNAYLPQSPVDSRSRQSSVASPVNPYAPGPQKSYAPVQSNFGPYQPSTTAGTDTSRSSSFSGAPPVFSPQESRFNPMAPSDLDISGSNEPSVKFTAYEPPKVHTISSIPEDDETYDDFVEEEDSDEDEISKKKEPVKEEKPKPKQKKKNDASDGQEGGSGWFGWLRKGDNNHNGPTVYKAKLGEANNFVYDENLKRWVDKNASPEELQAAVAPPPPPPIIKKKPSSIGKPRSDSVPEAAPSLNTPIGAPPIGQPSTTIPMVAPSAGGPPLPGAPPGQPGPPGPKKTVPVVSDLDSLLSAGGSSTRRKKKPGRGYVNVMTLNSDDK